MAKRRTAKLDPFKYAMAQSRSVGGRIGWFDRNPAARADVEAFVKAWRSGSQMGLTQAHAWLVEHHGYPSTVGALRVWLHTHHAGWLRRA